MSRNQVFKMPNSGVWKYQNVRNPGFWKCTEFWIFEKSRFSKFRDFLRDARFIPTMSIDPKCKFVLVPSMCEGSVKYFKAPEPAIESFLAQPCSALEVV